MTRVGVSATVSLTLLGSLLGVWLQSSYYLHQVLVPGLPFAVLRAVLALGLLAYAMNSRLHLPYLRLLLRAAGLCLLMFGLGALISPTLLGHLSSYYPIGDALLFLELGIWTMVISYEVPVEAPVATIAVTKATKPRQIRMPAFSWVSLVPLQALAFYYSVVKRSKITPTVPTKQLA